MSDEIDALEEYLTSDPAVEQKDTGKAQLKGRSGRGGDKAKKISLILIVILLLAAVVIFALKMKKNGEEKPNSLEAHEVEATAGTTPKPLNLALREPPQVPVEPIEPDEDISEIKKGLEPVEVEVVSPPVTQPNYSESGTKELTPAEELELLRLQPVFQSSSSSAGVGGNLGAQSSVQTEIVPDGLSGQFSPLKLNPSLAGKSTDPSLTISQGAMTTCILRTKFSTNIPGMVICDLERPVYSDDGLVVLLEAQSRVTSYYSGGFSLGDKRASITSARIRTPKGVIVNIDSPMAGALGQAGVTGHIDDQNGKRFGAALFLALIEDSISNAASSSSGGGDTFNLGNTEKATSSIAEQALEKYIDIPSILTKNNGDRVSIIFARDLFFGEVYDLSSKF